MEPTPRGCGAISATEPWAWGLRPRAGNCSAIFQATRVTGKIVVDPEASKAVCGTDQTVPLATRRQAGLPAASLDQ